MSAAPVRWHLPTLLAAALAFALLPQLLTGVPLGRQLSSDAEQFVAVAVATAVPAFAEADHGMPTGFGPSIWSFRVTRSAALAMGVSFPALSVWLSVAFFLVFVTGLYLLVRAAVGDATVALVVALIGIIPVHALGASTLGFQPLGVLARDVALTGVMFILWGYIRAVFSGGRWPMVAVFAACGLAANLYSLYFGQLFLVLGLTELLRLRAIGPVILPALAFGVCALPGVTRDLLMATGNTPVDVELMRRRHDFAVAWPLVPAITRYLRRFILYALACVVVVPFAWPQMDAAARKRQAPWTAMLLAAGLLSVIGVLIESLTPYMKFFLSKTSMYFYLAAAITLCLTLPAAVAGVTGRRSRASALALLAGVMLFQSNLPSIYRSIRDTSVTRDERAQMFDAITRLRELTGPGDVWLVPSPPERDLAATVRAYAERPVFVTYKDGALALLDGDLGRAWWDRFQRQEAALAQPTGQALLALMAREGVQWALLDGAHATLAADPALQPLIVERVGAFTLIRRDGPAPPR